MNNKFQSTPSSLHATLRRIKRYLDGGRAAVMVGSGFSKNADMTGGIDDVYGKTVPSMIYGKHEGLRGNPISLSWKALAENEEVFNDQRMGWRKGEYYQQNK